MKKFDIVSFGGCYLDINASRLAFDSSGIPTETELRGASYDCLPGGSGLNFARTLKGLDRRCLFIGMRGDDNIGNLVEMLCDREGLDTVLMTAEGKYTNVSVGLVGKEDSHVVFSVGNANQALDAELLLPRLDKYLGTETYLYMGTLYKLDSLADDFPAIISLGREKGLKIVVDHGRFSPSISEERIAQVRSAVLLADYYLPSRAEFLKTWEVESIEQGLKLLERKAKDLVVVVKDGSRGAHYLENGRMRTIAPPEIRGAHTITGAGDAFNAGFLDALWGGETLPAAITRACTVAASHVGSGTPGNA